MWLVEKNLFGIYMPVDFPSCSQGFALLNLGESFAQLEVRRQADRFVGGE